jgi:hypothetical protein
VTCDHFSLVSLSHFFQQLLFASSLPALICARLIAAGIRSGFAFVAISATSFEEVVVGVFPGWRIYAEVAAASSAGAGRS